MAYRYKIVEGAKFAGPGQLEEVLNQAADEGWRFVGLTTLGVLPSTWFVMERQELPH